MESIQLGMKWGMTPENTVVINKKGMIIENPIKTINPITPKAINFLVLLSDSLLFKLMPQ